LDAVGTRTIAVDRGAVHSHVGGWAEYLRAREDAAAAPPPTTGVAASAPSAGEPRRQRGGPSDNGETERGGVSKNRARAVEQAEAAVEQAEAAMRELEVKLAEPSAWATRYEAAKSEARHTAARRAVEQAYERLEALVDG
jgi:ATP-binding cassette, subfamily F, member 3